MSRGSTAFHNGMAAEEAVARAYEARGGKILERRWKVRAGEIDLIIQEAGVIVFVEVKSRKTLELAMAAVTPRQQARIMASAEQFLARSATLESPCRFDLAATNAFGHIEILENVFSG